MKNANISENKIADFLQIQKQGINGVFLQILGPSKCKCWDFFRFKMHLKHVCCAFSGGRNLTNSSKIKNPYCCLSLFFVFIPYDKITHFPDFLK